MSAAFVSEAALTGALGGFWFGLAGEIEGDCGADEVLERSFVDLFAFVDVDGAADIAFEAGVEEASWIVQRRALREGELDDTLVGLARADDARAGEDGCARR